MVLLLMVHLLMDIVFLLFGVKLTNGELSLGYREGEMKEKGGREKRGRRRGEGGGEGDGEGGGEGDGRGIEGEGKGGEGRGGGERWRGLFSSVHQTRPLANAVKQK